MEFHSRELTGLREEIRQASRRSMLTILIAAAVLVLAVFMAQ